MTEQPFVLTVVEAPLDGIRALLTSPEGSRSYLVQIDPKQSQRSWRESLLHEVIHALVGSWGMQEDGRGCCDETWVEDRCRAWNAELEEYASGRAAELALPHTMQATSQ